MAMNMKLQAKMSQQLIMNPQLQQAIKLLQMSRLEMEQFIQQNLLENPVLEEQENFEEPSAAEEEDFSSEDNSEQDFLEDTDTDYDSYDMENEFPQKNKDTDFNEKQNIIEATISKKITLVDHLVEQIGLGDYNEKQQNILYYLANNLYDNGYLYGNLIELLAADEEIFGEVKSLYANYPMDKDFDASIGEVFYSTEYQKKTKHLQDRFHCKIEEVPARAIFVLNSLLLELQKMDPFGCGSRSLQECLCVQAKIKFKEHSREYKILSEYWDFFVSKKYKRIARKLGVEPQTIENSVQKIQVLSPFPGDVFLKDDLDTVIPDVYLIEQDKEYKIRLNEKFHKFGVNPYYKEMIKDYSKKKIFQSKITTEEDQSKRYILEKVRAGEWLIKNIEQRQETILKVTESIVKKQKKFFRHGKEHLKPMVLKEVADDIGMHESTVSRITNRKYLHTPRGVFELKYFFSSGIQQEGGEFISSLRIKEYIEQIISKEKSSKPVTDNYIVLQIAKEQNIKLARRTIAKYREAMGIPASNRRRIR
jgi:RNA polymerase sigma-54 factor